MRVPEHVPTSRSAPRRKREVRALVGGLALLTMMLVPEGDVTGAASSIPPHVVTTSSSSLGYQHPAQDKVAYLHDGSLLIGFFNGSTGVVDQVRNPGSSAQSVAQVQTIAGDEVTFYTLAGATSTDIWIQAGAELVGSAPLEQIRHGTYDGTSFTWDSATSIPGTISPGRQDPSVTWSGKWLIATWWDDTNLSDSDNLFMNWTADRTGQSGWLTTVIHMTATDSNITQPNIRHSAKLGATVLVYGTHYRDLYRVLLDSRTDPSLGNWTAETVLDSGYDDSEAGYGGPQVAIDEASGNIHVFRAVINAGGPTWHGVTYWLGRPDAAPMATGHVTWNSRLIIDGAASTDPPDIAGAIDASGKVFVFWVTSASSGALKYATLVSPYITASSITTLSTLGSQPRYPHVPAQSPLNRGYVPLVYQSGTGSPYSIVLDTTIAAAGGDTTPPTVPTGLVANASTSTQQVNLSWNASTDNVGVTGYTVYRNDSALGAVSGTTLAYTDNTVASLTSYSYAVDAFDGGGNHSTQSTPASVTTPDWTPPSVPAGVTATAASPTEIDLSWSAATDNVGVAGYDVYRDTALLVTLGPAALTFTDTVVAGSTHAYTVDAFDAAGNHSAQSSAVTVTTPSTPPPAPKFVQANVVTGGSRATTMTVTLGPVAKGDLLVGMFGQYDANGQVGVTDNVNGAWTRSISTTWRGSAGTAGDIALYYSPTATYLQGSAAEYSGVAALNPLDQAVMGNGTSTTADSGLTPAVAAGELIYGGMVATNGAGTLTPGASQGVTFVKRGQSSSGTQGEEDIAGGAAGQQHAGFTFTASVRWFMVSAAFRAG